MDAPVSTRRREAFSPRMLLLPVTALSVISFTACSKEKEKETEPVVPVQVAEVRRDSIQRIITADAILFPKSQSGVTPKISAPVRSFHVNRGDHVRKGQLLATLENRDLAAAVVDTKGAYEQAQAQLKNTAGATVPEDLTKARQDVESTRQAMEAALKVYQSRQALLKEGAIARKLVEDANVAYVQARSQYQIAQEHLQALQSVSRHETIRGAQGQAESARGKYEAAEAQLSYSEIRSPMDGVIADRPLYPGEMASSGTPLVEVMDISRVIARANVPVAQAAFLKAGGSATIAQMDANISVPGKITVVSPAVDPSTTTVQVWVEAPNPGERLHPGVTVKVSAIAETINDAVVIPQSALLPSQEGITEVMVVGADSVAHERKIETGVRQDDKVQILSGLKPGEKVVTVGGLGLQDGSKVTLQTAKPAGEEKAGKEEKEK